MNPRKRGTNLRESQKGGSRPMPLCASFALLQITDPEKVHQEKHHMMLLEHWSSVQWNWADLNSSELMSTHLTACNCSCITSCLIASKPGLWGDWSHSLADVSGICGNYAKSTNAHSGLSVSNPWAPWQARPAFWPVNANASSSFATACCGLASRERRTCSNKSLLFCTNEPTNNIVVNYKW